jgi:hypothetical protein
LFQAAGSHAAIYNTSRASQYVVVYLTSSSRSVNFQLARTQSAYLLNYPTRARKRERERERGGGEEGGREGEINR